jgi:raffinose/stachyose/melibiose transport system substrate-binding protein
MMKKTRAAAVAALGLGVVLGAAACTSGSSSSTASGGSSSAAGGSSSAAAGGSSSAAAGPVTLTFWNNATPGPGLTYYQGAVKAFEAAHPGVTINMQNIQNEDYDGKLQTALNSNTAPDIFFQRGGGKELAMVNAGQLQALNLTAADKANVIPGALAADSINGTVYGIPLDANPEGIYYSKDLFSKAGITSTPTTIPELEADVAKLKTSGVAPIAVGAKDAWHRPVLDEGRRRPDGVPEGQPVPDGFPDDRRAGGRGLLGRPAGQPQGRHGAHGRLGPGRDRQPDPEPEGAA